VGVAGDDVFAPHQTEVEAEHDLADAVAFGFVELRDLVEPQPLDVLRDEHASGREIRVHARHANVRMAPEQPREATLLLRLDLVVELIGDPLAHLAQQRSGVTTGRQALNDRAHQPEGAQVAADRLGDVRVLHLHRDVLAGARVRAVDLTEGGDREWLLVDCGEDVLQAGMRSCSITRRRRRSGIGARA
jgi:hypothetical protein